MKYKLPYRMLSLLLWTCIAVPCQAAPYDPFQVTLDEPCPGNPTRLPAAPYLEKAAGLIDTAANGIFDPAQTMRPVYEKMQRILIRREGQLSIVHIGDSHVQADFFGAAFRQLLQARLGSAGRGLLTPLRQLGTNAPLDYRILTDNRWHGTPCTRYDPSATVGITGTVITSTDSLVRLGIRCREPFDRISIFHHPRSAILTGEETCMIPDTTAGCGVSRFVLTSPKDSIRLTARCDSLHPDQIYYGFLLERDTCGAIYHAIGLNSASFSHFARNPQFAAALPALQPDLIIVSLGTNDAYGSGPEILVKQAATLLETLRLHNPDAVILLTTPMQSCRSVRGRNGRRVYVPNTDSERVADSIRCIGLREGIACWNLFRATGGPEANRRWNAAGLFRRDRIHLMPEGYALQATMLYNALACGYTHFSDSDHTSAGTSPGTQTVPENR